MSYIIHIYIYVYCEFQHLPEGMPSSTFQHLPNAPIFLKAQRSGGRRGVKRPRGRGAWMGAGLRAQIEKYNNKVIRSGGHWFVTGEGPLPILQYIYISYIIYHI